MKRTSKINKTSANSTGPASSIKVSGYYTIIFFLLLLLIDRLTKTWAVGINGAIDYGLFSFIYTTNTGAGFSIFQDSNALLIWIAVIVMGLLIYFGEHFPRAGFILIMSGLIGNLIDRIAYGYVIDFINLKFWPVFNAADSFIVIGAIISVIYSFMREGSTKSKPGKAAKRNIKIT